MASPVNFLARGERVAVSSESSKPRSSQINSRQNTSPGRNDDTTSLPSITVSPAKKPVAHQSTLKLSDQVVDLSKTLVFGEDAVSSMGAHICSYASARQGSRKLFTHHNMHIFTDQETRKKKLLVPPGRHNTRGAGSKHGPCYHVQPLLPHGCKVGLSTPPLPVSDEAIDPHPSLEKRAKKKWTKCQEASIFAPFVPKEYTHQLEAGAKPLHVVGKDSTIFLDNNTIFKKVLQATYPQPPAKYIFSKEKPQPNASLALTPGHRRWLSLPQPIEPSAELPWECYSVGSSSRLTERDDSNLSSFVSEQLERHEFFMIMRKWCSQWKLHIRLREVGGDSSLVHQLNSVSDHTRMYAVAAVSVLAENQAVLALKPRPLSGLLLESSASPRPPTPWTERQVSAELVRELERLLSDSAVHVRVPSAITLYCLDRQTEKAEEVLHAVLVEGVRVSERWAAVQCLVCAGGHVSPAIVSELLLHLLDSRSSAEQERATALLARASCRTDLVHSMVADQLNNSGWQERLAACTVLPLLHNSINRDLYTKLLELAWEDWSPEVQHAAAKALGRASHAKIIHDDIIMRLKDESVLVRLDAIRKLHSLHLMTSKLLPSYLACFCDQHLSIRLEAAVLAGSLRLKHPQVLKALKLQLRDDCWMLKTSSLRALADIGPLVFDPELVELLMWAVRFEKVAAVREEACRTIGRLGLSEDRVVQALKDLVTVEEDEAVVCEAQRTLLELGHSEQVQDQMLEGVCDTVKQLCTKEAITEELMTAEANRLTAYGLRRPARQLTVRDYLDDRQRYLMYGDGSAKPREERRDSAHTNKGSVLQLPHERHSLWTPDRLTIDTQLDKMRRRVNSSTL